jgi:hypothetical protein
MARSGSLALFMFGAAALLALREIHARCMDSPFYYCASAVFEREVPELNPPGGSKECAGLITVSGRSVTALLFGEKSCPPAGTRLVGHLAQLCQEHPPPGTRTNAQYGFSKEQAFCGKSHDEALREAGALAAKIHLGMTRGQVRDAVHLEDYPRFGDGLYFVYPDVGLKVSFDISGGIFSWENKVDGPSQITKLEILRPWQNPWLKVPDLPAPPEMKFTPSPSLSAPPELMFMPRLPDPPAPN